MPELEADTWEAFEAHLKQLRQKHRGSTPLLFRGQDDATWPLTTTLERAGEENMCLTAYYEAIRRASSEIETHTEIDYGLPSYNKMDLSLRDCGAGPRALLDMPVYRYMLYLRHHGFPSPLLDWTRSPYVAAYFAFYRVPRKPSSATFKCPVCGQKSTAKLDATVCCGKCAIPMGKNERKVSIYVFSETPEDFKEEKENQSRIIRCGPFVRTHRRHFLQQSEYSICVVHDTVCRFAPHEEVFGRNNPHQDILTKINIPSTERLKVLKLLDDHNLNAFSLFASEESLVETVALRTLDAVQPNSPT